jgi:glycosyltransferase involved in cell wall biosynthesis
MKLALISARYRPESSPSAKRASDLADALQSAGHRVTILTQLPNYPDPAAFDFEAPEGSPVVIEEDGAGNAVWRFVPRVVSKDDLVRRVLAESRFARLVSRRRTALRDLDGVIASTPFVFNLRAAHTYGVPVWLDVRDLTWEYARDLGQPSILKRTGGGVLRSIALSCLRQADGVSTTTGAQGRYLAGRGVPGERIRVVPNGVPRAVIDELARLRAGAATEPAGGPIRVVYAGLLGFPQGLELAVRAVEGMRDEQIELHLYGDGVDRPRLVEHCRARGLGHVHLHGFVSHDEYLRAIAGADVLLASLRPQAATAMPSKVFEYMAAGRPVVFAGTGEGAEVVEGAGAGLTVPYGDERALAERLRELARDDSLRAELGANGRAWVLRNRVREDINRAWVEDIERAFGAVAGGRSRGLLRPSSTVGARDR